MSNIECPACKGEGSMKGRGHHGAMRDCTTCGGSGMVARCVANARDILAPAYAIDWPRREAEVQAATLREVEVLRAEIDRLKRVIRRAHNELNEPENLQAVRLALWSSLAAHFNPEAE